MQRSTRLLALAAAFCGSALATPVMDWRAPDLLMMAPDLKGTLKLNANQATLWNQTESRTRALLRERQSRQEQLQARALQALQANGVELRALAGALDGEDTTLLAENHQLREWWLTVNDALDDVQRQAVAVFLAEQLQRKPEGPGRGDGPPRGEAGGGGHGGHKGAMGGMGGGPGGINIGLGGR
ncbi:hypothetical protein C9I28_02600 [Pseudoduganella armeniaca]|uniref:Periplasmic heavy metal sensor n=1 Tax=Pseudoduganella armeniaca TaxID=2072590 RepID=A0A2R4CHD9_9BURK|nr:hypothetical protein C9I28_02600 [Pseudoduganella armeniaca]